MRNLLTCTTFGQIETPITENAITLLIGLSAVIWQKLAVAFRIQIKSLVTFKAYPFSSSSIPINNFSL